jgi:AAA15 family ATPase/GTPase
MLVQFRVKNFLSFRDEQVLNMVASSDDTLIDNTIETSPLGSLRLLRSAVLYGANASGKSNLILALAFVGNFVDRSAERKPGSEIHAQPFLLDEHTRTQPSEFEVTFIHEGMRYQYGFSVDSKRVHEEWLIAYPRRSRQVWFHRKPQTDAEGSEWYYGPGLKGERKRIEELTRPDVLFLSVAAKFNHKQLSLVYRWLSDRLRSISAQEQESLFLGLAAQSIQSDRSFYEQVLRFLGIADLGITDIQAETVKGPPSGMPEQVRALFQQGDWESYRVQLFHRTSNSGAPLLALPLESESLGTRRLLCLAVPWIPSLREGFTLAVDELDASLHPLLVRFLVRLFHTPAVNLRGAQLVFNTHDTTLLDSSLFRRDQIWFVEKDEGGASHLYPLLDYSPRKNEALAKGYLQGRYGAIPFISGDLGGLLSHEQEETAASA